MNKFEVVKRFQGVKQINLPKRATANAAGYDFEVAEDTVVPSIWKTIKQFEAQKKMHDNWKDESDLWELTDIAIATKESKIKPTLVPTGIKCQLDINSYLEISARSSLPLKHWLILANGVGRLFSKHIKLWAN